MIWWVTDEVLGMSSGLKHQGGPAQPGVKKQGGQAQSVFLFIFFILALASVIVGRKPCVLGRGCGITISCASFEHEVCSYSCFLTLKYHYRW